LNQFFKNGKEDWRTASRLAETTIHEKNLVNWSESSQMLSTSRCYTSTGHPILFWIRLFRLHNHFLLSPKCDINYKGKSKVWLLVVERQEFLSCLVIKKNIVEE
jgi:hypothetical protein